MSNPIQVTANAAHMGGLSLEAMVPLVRQVVDDLLRRHRRSRDFGDDFRGWVFLKIVEREVGIRRQFRGDCTLRTYLSVIVNRLYCDYLIRSKGKWRNSRMATTLGESVVRLEKLVYHDGFTLDEAVAALETYERRSGSNLRDAFNELPRRQPRSFVGLDSLPEIPSNAEFHADVAVRRRELLELSRWTHEKLATAVLGLSLEDRRLLELRFAQGLRIPEISRRLGSHQSRIYGRLRRLLEALRVRLESNGVQKTDVEELVVGNAPPFGRLGILETNPATAQSKDTTTSPCTPDRVVMRLSEYRVIKKAATSSRREYEPVAEEMRAIVPAIPPSQFDARPDGT